MNKHKEKSMNTRTAIIQAFWALLKEKGFQKITVNDITQKAGIYRSTFYLHFTDIFDLLRQVEDSLVDEWRYEIISSVEETMLTDIVDLISKFYEKNGDRIFLLLNEKGASNFEKKIKKTISYHVKRIFNISDDLEFDYVFEFYIDGVLGMLNKWYHERESVPINSVIALIQNIISNGVLFQDNKNNL